MVAADSWVDVKGNGWTIEGNTGTAAPQDGFQVHEVVDGWGQHNVFAGNVSNVDGSGYAINVAGPRGLRASTEVRCDNSVQSAAQGLTNVDCARP
jgi:ABC-type histidine transport system ATPase subunit